jgi:hypothetical protein
MAAPTATPIWIAVRVYRGSRTRSLSRIPGSSDAVLLTCAERSRQWSRARNQ